MAYPKNNTFESIIREQNVSDGGYVQMEWNSTDNAALPVGSVCPVDSDYILFSAYHPSQSSAYSFHYSVKFLHRMAQLDYLPFYFKTKAVNGIDEEGNVTYEDITLSTYPYTGNISTIANALAQCLSDHRELGSWTADTSGLSDSIIQSINFDGATVKSAGTQIADAFGVECFFLWSSRTIKFGSIDAGGGSPSYGRSTIGPNGVTESAGTLVSATDGGIQYNTFRILGGTRNMSRKTIKGQNVQVTQRLMLDGDSIIGGGSPKIMKDLVFDDIYPKMELWIYDVHERRCWLTDENGKKIVDAQETDPETGGVVTTYKQYSKWYFKLAYWNGTELVPYVFDTSLLIAGLPLSMVFQPNYVDGALPQPLIGREFELTYFDADSPAREKEADDIGNGYQPSHGEYRIIFKVDGGMILPSTSEEGIRPYGNGMSLVNNKVTLVNVAMDDIYKEAAKVELRKAGEAAANAYTSDKSSYTYLTYGAAPSLGGNVTMVRTDMITGEVQYTVGSYHNSKGLIGRLSDKIESINAGGGGTITNDDSTGGRGGGVSESSIPLLSRLMGSGSVIKDSLTILKELILGTNGHGVFIDGNGDANMTIGSLTVLGTTHLNEIDVNHIKHTGGLMVVTKANIIVDHVEHLDGGLDKLYFRRVDGNGQRIYNQFEVGDLALMMVFNEALDGSINRYFWREVSAIDDGSEEFGYIILLPSSVTHSEPREGDVVVQLGNTQKAERQGCTVLGGSGPYGGFFAVYDGFNTWREAAPSLNDYDTAITYISPKKNKINGDFVSVAGENIKEQLEALRASLLSVREQSDKQLVIWYGDDDAPLPNSGDLDHWNDPAKDWHDADEAAGNTAQQELHLEDVYYLRRNNTTRKGGRAWQWTYDAASGKFLWVEITDADTIAALEAADDAVNTANEAKRKVLNLADDGIISAGTEKSQLLTQWQDTVAEYINTTEQAKDYELEKEENTVSGSDITYTPYNDYVRKYKALADMLNSHVSSESVYSGNAVPTWLQSLNTDVILSDENITANTYRTAWEDYFNSRGVLLKAIEVAARQKTEKAQEDATNALNQISDMGNDKKLDPSEKLTVKREFLAAWRERDASGGILDRCKDGNVYINDTIEAGFVNPYKTAFLAVATYLNGSNGTWTDTPYPIAKQDDFIPLWLHSERMNTTETIDGDTWRNLWSAFYAARTALLTALSDDAKDRADNAQETADKKKRVFSTAANELPPAPYDVGDLWVNAVWYTEKDGVRTFKWTGDVLYCIQGRSTNANRSINDWSDAASGTTAKIANLGTQIEAEVRDRKNGTSSLLKLDPTSGSLTVNVYDAATDTWSSIGNIELALARGANGIFSKLNLTANNVTINSDLMTVISQGVSVQASQVDFTVNGFSIDASKINFTATDSFKTAVANSGVVLEEDLITAFVDGLDDADSADMDELHTKLGMVIRRDGTSGEFSFGSWIKDNSSIYQWVAGLSFKTANGKTKLQLKADNVEINSDLIISGNNVEFGGSLRTNVEQSIDGALDNFIVRAKHIGFTASDLNITAGDVDFSTGNYKILATSHIDFTGYTFRVNASNITFDTKIGAGNINFTTGTFTIAASHIKFSGESVDLTSATVSLNANQITFNGKNVDLTGANLTLNAGQLNYEGQFVNLSVANVNLNAGQINWSVGSYSISAVDHIDFTGYTFHVKANNIDFESGTLKIAAENINFKTGNFAISNGSDNTLSVDASGNITVKGTINAEAGYFKGELQGATGTFAGSLKSNDNKVVLTSTAVSTWGSSYLWRGFAVTNNGLMGGDLATIGARLNISGNDYGRIALAKRPTGTYDDNSAEINIILSASDGSIQSNTVSAVTGVFSRLSVDNCLRQNTSIIFRTFYKKEITTNNTIYDLSSSNGDTQIINSTADGGDSKAGVALPQLSDVYSVLGLESGTNFCVRFLVCANLGSNNFYVYGRNTRKTSSNEYPWNDNKYPLITHWNSGQWDRVEMGAGDSLEFLLIYDSSRTATIDNFDTKYTARIINKQD